MRRRSPVRVPSHTLLFRGFVTIELLFVIALIGFIAIIAVGTLQRTMMWCERSSMRSAELREEVWCVGLLQKGKELGRDGGGPTPIAAVERRELIRRATQEVGIDPRTSETLISCRLRGTQTMWIVGGIQGTRRWRS
jgi:hypothetical protein